MEPMIMRFATVMEPILNGEARRGYFISVPFCSEPFVAVVFDMLTPIPYMSIYCLIFPVNAEVRAAAGFAAWALLSRRANSAATFTPYQVLRKLFTLACVSVSVTSAEISAISAACPSCGGRDRQRLAARSAALPFPA